MNKTTLLRVFLFAFLALFSQILFAWNHSVELGYGHSHDPNDTKHYNSGVLLSGDIVPLLRNDWTFWSITGSLGRWYSTAPHNKNLTSVAASIALRFYPFLIANQYPSYFLASFGPAYITARQFGVNKQAENVTIQSNLGVGVEFNYIDVNLRLSHFSNGSMSKPNNGYNVLYLLSIGYLF